MRDKVSNEPWWRSNLLAFVLSVVFAISASYMTAIRTGAEVRVAIEMRLTALEHWQVDASRERLELAITAQRIAENQLLIGTGLNRLLEDRGLPTVVVRRAGQ